jgi:16S rRNA (guanine966-N2)-methyltransferase
MNPQMTGTLRITGGNLVRQRFEVPEEADQHLVRPTSDRVREAIFSALGHRVLDARVLDLFAGSGASSFESLSRGAQSAICVEKSRSTAACIKRNIAKLKLQDKCHIIEGDALNPPLQKGGQGGFFDIIFVDPPYKLKLDNAFWLNLRRHMAPDALVVFRCGKQSDFILPEGFEIIREKTYGGTWVAFMSLAS